MEPGGFEPKRFLASLAPRWPCSAGGDSVDSHGPAERSVASGVRVIALDAMTRPRKREVEAAGIEPASAIAPIERLQACPAL